MQETNYKYDATVINDIKDINPIDWDTCAGENNPFIKHAFLAALEESGSVTPKTGWLPQHIILRRKNNEIVACMPMYLKSHSFGEYIFDWGWGEAYERAGGNYYPKLQSSVPFTPATGERLLIKNPKSKEDKKALIHSIIDLSQKHKVSSTHVTFMPKEQCEELGKFGFIQRISKQFHWENKGYSSFDDFLSVLTSRKRKTIRKERNRVAQQNISFEILTGNDLNEKHWDQFYSYYIDTIDRKWGQPYLTREFFSIIGETIPQLIVLIMAKHQGSFVAGALNLTGGDTIFGRNWGCGRDFKFLHFEACYYQAIEFAINNRLRWVEAGAQGPHKIQRGYMPRETYSAHLIADTNFRNAVKEFVNQEKEQIGHEIEELINYSPYRSNLPD